MYIIKEMLVLNFIILIFTAVSNAKSMSSIGYIKNYEDLPASDSDHTEQQSTLQILQDRDTIDQKGYPAAVDKVDVGIRHKRQAEPAPGAYLLFANILSLVLLQNVPTLRINTYGNVGSNVVAVDFDKRDQYIFWSDVRNHSIFRSFENGSGVEVVVNSGIITPDGIAWDWVNKKLYWTDAGDRDLEVYDPRTGFRKVIFQFGATALPRAIIVDPSTKYMYWSDWGTPAKIERASMDGANRRVLHNTDLHWPNAMTIDYHSQILYWIDAGTDRMEKSHVDGSNRQLLSTRHIYHPFSIAFFNGNLFWSDWHVKAILSAPSILPNAVGVIIRNLTHNPMGVTVVSDDRQRIVPNPCEGRCSGERQSCLLSTNPPNFSCVSGSQVSVDNGLKIGLEKEKYFLNDNGCSVLSVCVKFYKSPRRTSASEFYIVKLMVNYGNSSNQSSVLVTLTPSIQRQCINVDIDQENFSKNTTVVISKYKLPPFATLSPRTAAIITRPSLTIGLEQTNFLVYEDDGAVMICVSIQRPSSLSELVDDQDYNINFVTKGSDGEANVDFIPVTTQMTLNISSPRQCNRIEIIHDHVHEGVEKFFVVISNDDLPSYVRLNPKAAQVQVVNTKREFTIGFDRQEVEVLETAGKIKVCIHGPETTSGTITMMVNIPNSFNTDVSFSNSSSHSVIHLDSGHNRSCVDLTIIDDSESEGDEVVTLTLETVCAMQPLYLVINPTFMNIRILDNDALIVGFEKPTIEVTRTTDYATFDVCARIRKWPSGLNTKLILSMVSHEGIVAIDDNFQVNQPILLSRVKQHYCHTMLITPADASDRSNKTFSVSLRPVRTPPNIHMENKTILIKILTDQGTLNCGSAMHQCEYSCSNASHWTEWSAVPSSEMNVSKYTCQSEKAVIKNRSNSLSGRNCNERGQFCVPSKEEKLASSFKLGISTRSLVTQVHRDSVNCAHSTESSCRLQNITLYTPNGPKLNSNTKRCISSRPQFCGNRSVLFVLDSSASVGAENFKKMTSAVAELTKHMCGNVKAAVVKFNGNTFLDICFDCITNSRYDLSKHIDNVAYESKGSNARDIGSATHRIRSHLFSEDCGDHSTSDCIDIVYITGGQSNSGPPVCNEVRSLKHSLPLRDSICNKTRVYAIGIGRRLNTTELRCIADNPVNGQDTVFHFPSFNDFKKTIGKSVQYLFEKKVNCQRNEEPNSSYCDGGRLDASC